MNEYTAFIYLLCVALICVMYGWLGWFSFTRMREDHFPIWPSLGIALFWPFALIAIILSLVFIDKLDEPTAKGQRYKG